MKRTLAVICLCLALYVGLKTYSCRVPWFVVNHGAGWSEVTWDLTNHVKLRVACDVITDNMAAIVLSFEVIPVYG